MVGSAAAREPGRGRNCAAEKALNTASGGAESAWKDVISRMLRQPGTRATEEAVEPAHET